MYRISIYMLLIIGVTYANAQVRNVLFDDEYFSNKKEQLKIALKELKKGDKQFKKGNAGYVSAIEPYLKAHQINPNNSVLNYKLGVCFLKGKIEPKALEYLEHAARIDLWVSEDKKIQKLMYDYYYNHLHYLLGQAYHLNLNWDKAIEHYLNFKKVLHSDDLASIEKEIDKKIAECNEGKLLLQEPINVRIDNMGPEINSPYSDYGAFFTSDESQLYFTSRRKRFEEEKISRHDFQYFEDVYGSKKSAGKWDRAVNVGKPINSSDHDATAGLSNDGQQLFLFRNKKGKDGGDIYLSYLKGEKWSRPKKLPKPINSKYHETTASLSYDERTLYFISARPGGYGGRDIYRARKNIDGDWHQIENLGPLINSSFDEDFIFVHPDGKALYFSSKGHNSMGGYDIFKTEILSNGSFSKPENLGFPVNSPGDDVEFRLSAKGDRGMYTSARPKGIGEKDIYTVKFLGGGKPLILTTEEQLLSDVSEMTVEELIEPEVKVPEKKVTILKGQIIDAITDEPIEAEIELVDNVQKQVIAKFKSNSKSGQYLVCLPSGKNYGISINAPGYLFHSQNVDIPEVNGYQEISKDVKLNKLDVGSRIVLNNIFFDYNKASIKSESFAELERLVELMIVEPYMRVEISGHTDNVGSDSYNKKLSNERAKAVVDLMVSLGIASDRFEYIGHGFDQPIADNETDEGRQRNRRTEFKILSK